ncbi:MAG: hypothetical protein LLG97_17655 [Deltaproteobacteria bacterium]|nr:hypothetical protein [Deltaproteobacteria bacterium]
MTLRDKNGIERGPVATDSSGNFSFDVTGLAPPFILKAEGWVGAQSYTLYSAATVVGKAHINPFTHLVLAVAAGVDPAQVFGPAGGTPDVAAINDAALRAALAKIKTLLQPLLDEYGITDFDPLSGDYEANPGNRLDAMLDLIRVEFASGSVTIANKLTGSVIASGSAANLNAISLDKTRAPSQSRLAEIQAITTRLTELCAVMNLGADLTAQVLDGFFIPDPQYGTSNGHTRAEDIASIPAIFGPGGTNTRGRVLKIRNVRLVSDITTDYFASRGVERAFILNYDFIHENGDIVRGTNVTFAREASSGLWKFVGDPDQNNNGSTSNYGCVMTVSFINYGTLDILYYSSVSPEPVDIASDGTSLYVVDSGYSIIRKIDISTGTSSTFAGSDGTIGNIDGVGTAAIFSYPQGITTDGTNLYVSDGNDRIRKIAISTREVTTLAEVPELTGLYFGGWSAARFGKPRSITTDGTNLFYIGYPDNNRIRKTAIASGGAVGTLDGVEPVRASDSLKSLTSDGTNLYVTEGFQRTILKIEISTETVTTLAGTPGAVGTADGIGPEARFTSPTCIATDGVSLYVADNSTIRKVAIATGAVTTLAGAPGISGSIDGTGGEARFTDPRSLTTDGTNVYVIDGNKAIRKVEISTGVVTTY